MYVFWQLLKQPFRCIAVLSCPFVIFPRNHLCWSLVLIKNTLTLWLPSHNGCRYFFWIPQVCQIRRISEYFPKKIFENFYSSQEFRRERCPAGWLVIKKFKLFQPKKCNNVLSYQDFHIMKLMFKQSFKNIGYCWLMSDILLTISFFLKPKGCIT